MGTSNRYEKLMQLLMSGAREELEVESQFDAGFPEGVDNVVGRRWIINAVDSGSTVAIEWMLSKGVNLAFVDDEGRSPILAALERNSKDRYQVLEALLAAGAPVNDKGFNDYTPAHQAASWDDVESLKLLVRYGANLSLHTDIDERATPLEIAQLRGSRGAINYLKSVV